MATKTDKYELRKKEDNDFYNIDDFNDNMDKIETALTEFDDSGSADGITSFTDMLTKLVTGNKLAVTLRNLKAGLQFVLHAGSIVNNCVTDNAKLPLSAAQGKALQDAITKLNGEASSHLIASGSENSFCAAFQSRYQYYTNANYMLASGIYKTGKTGLNLPFEGYWIIITFNTSNGFGNSSTAWITQFAISTDWSDKTIYFRRNINYTPTAWESWNRLVAS